MSEKAQIVFLVDVNQPDHVSNSSDQSKITTGSAKVSQSISLSAFRFLHSLASRLEKQGFQSKSRRKQSNLQWGYKFFNSKSYVLKIERYPLREFKLRYFEEFENEVERRLDESQSRFRDSNQNGRKDIPSDCLSKALSELLYDFQWEQPDFTSPMKGRKSKNMPTNSFQKNIVVLFSECPKNYAQMKTFSGKRILDSEVFLGSFMSEDLLYKFHKHAKLTLMWIDTSFKTTSKLDVDVQCLRYVQDALAMLEGQLVPVEALAQRGSPHYGFISILSGIDRCTESEQDQEVIQYTSIHKTEGRTSTSLLPYTPLIDFCTGATEKNKSSRKSGQDTIEIVLDEQHTVRVCLVPAVSSSSQSDTVGNSHLRKRSDTHMIDLDHINDTAVTSSSAELPDTLADIFSDNSATLYAYGLLKQDSCVRTEICKGPSFVCTNVEEGSGSKTGSCSLTSVVKNLVETNSALVLYAPVVPVLFTLHSLTCSTAVLTVVPIGKVLTLEKELLGEQVGNQRPEDSFDQNIGSKCDNLISRVASSGGYDRGSNVCTYFAPSVPDKTGSGRYDGKVLDRWHVPGCKPALTSLINKLNDRLSQLNFLTGEEVAMLKQLQKAYKKESRPPGLREDSLPDKSLEEKDLLSASMLNLTQDESSNQSFSKPDSVPKASKKTTKSSSFPRGQLMFNISKEKVVKEKDKSDRDVAKMDQVSAIQEPSLNVDFKDTDELVQYLLDMYQKVVTNGSSGLDNTAQMLVSVVKCYMKQTEQQNANECTQKLLEDHLLTSASKLREKYANMSTEADKQDKIREYQLQILLQLETQSAVLSKDQSNEETLNDEIVAMLRTLSFLSEPNFLSEFMKNSMLNNYVHTIPRTLANIYDELTQPLPDVLANIFSPNSSGDNSILNSSFLSNATFDGDSGPPSARTRSHGIGSVGPPSNQPGSNKSDRGLHRSSSKRGGKLVHHPSFTDFGAKRQIMVQKITKKEKSSKKKKKDQPHKRSKDEVRKSLFDKKKGGVKLERRQTITVMERLKTPKKLKSERLLKSPTNLLTSPRRQIVAETPCHKQISSSRLRQQEKQPEGLCATEVVEESPVKEVRDKFHKEMPSQGKRARALIRRSFYTTYSAGPIQRTRNLTQYFQLGDRIAGRKSSSSVEDSKKLIREDDFKSPDKNSSFLLSQLIANPTPPRSTPHKLTGTPNKSVTESPSANTRSKVRSQLFSPEILPSAKRDLMFSPEAPPRRTPLRRNSPRIVVPDSGLKQDVTAHETPVKSPAFGSVTFGLDSPSQGKAIKTVTPTRKSVRAALFAKSPARSAFAMTRKDSGSMESPQKRGIDRFISPRKLSKRSEEWEAQMRQPVGACGAKLIKTLDVTKNDDICKFTGHTLRTCASRVGNAIPEKTKGENVTQSVTMGDNLTNSVTKGDNLPNSVTKGDSQSESGSQKTPSPCKRPKTKTPESFDKWHRRKPRFNLLAGPNGNKTNSTDLKMCEVKSGSSIETKSEVTGMPSLRNKRSLVVSPNQVVESPSKRQRLSVQNPVSQDFRTRSMINRESSREDSQGFDVAGSLSQASTASSLDYFSCSNDEVFLTSPESSQRKKIDVETDFESFSQKCSPRLKSHSSGSFSLSQLSGSFPQSQSSAAFSPRRKVLDRIISEEFVSSHDLCSDNEAEERSESPIFGLGRSARKHQKSTYSPQKKHPKVCVSPVSKSRPLTKICSITSGLDCEDDNLMETCENDENVNSSMVSPSLSKGKSPAIKKFSPNVSAKSLMHLIQSPLLGTHQQGAEKSDNESPGRDSTSSRSSQRSRRSLRLQN